MIKIVGITGPSGSGKSLLCKYVSESGIPCINADEVYHSMLTPPSECLLAIREAFGADVLNEDGSLDRATMSKYVFSDQAKLDLLNRTVLPLVIKKIKSIISELEKSGNSFVVVDAPTLIESRFNEECDLVVSVIASAETRISRIQKRDSISFDKAKLRISAQKPNEFYVSASDIVLTNDSNERNFLNQAAELLKTIKSI